VLGGWGGEGGGSLKSTVLVPETELQRECLHKSYCSIGMEMLIPERGVELTQKG